MPVFSMGEEPQRPAEPVEDKGPLSTSLAERFAEIALPHLDAVYRLARALASSEAEAEDLVQETWVRAYNGFAGFELRAHGARPWLFRILYNTFYTLKGKQRREPALGRIARIRPKGDALRARGQADADQVRHHRDHRPQPGRSRRSRSG